MFNPWSTDLWRMTGILLIALIVGLVTGYVAVALAVAFAAMLGWQLLQLRRFEEWARRGDWLAPPDIDGVWGEPYGHFYRLYQRNLRRKDKLVAILNRFQETAAAIPDATVVLDKNGEIQWWNEAAVRYLGLKTPQDVGNRIDNLIRYPVFSRYFHQTDYAEHVEIPSPEDRNVILSVKIVPYGNEQKLLVAQDVTRIIRLEQMRRDFVANVSHELKTPLTVIRGLIETLEDAPIVHPDQWRRQLSLMSQQSERMRNIVDDLLFLTRLETKQDTVKRAPVDVPTMLASLQAEALACSGEGKHKIMLEVDDSLWLQGDEHELRSAFSNLVMNAVRYSPDGGKITVRWWRDRKSAYLAVSDQGVGIPARDIPRLTERFYRVDSSRSRQSGGTGLGLAIVKHVLNRHHAELEVESVLGRGSTFTCVFPAERICDQKSVPRRNIVA